MKYRRKPFSDFDALIAYVNKELKENERLISATVGRHSIYAIIETDNHLLKTDKITGIRLRADSMTETVAVLIECDDGKEYELICDSGETIDHWVNMKSLDLKTLVSRKME